VDVRSGKGKVFVFTGPDGSGRKTVADRTGTTLDLHKIISFTTRPPRPGEAEGQDYHFVPRDLYHQMESSGELLESVTIGGNRYGLRESDIRDSLERDESIYLVVNREAADLLKRMMGERVVRIFIYADRRTVEERQRALGLSDAVIADRLSRFDYDMGYQNECELAYENYDLAHTVFDVTKALEGYLDRNLLEKD